MSKRKINETENNINESEFQDLSDAVDDVAPDTGTDTEASAEASAPSDAVASGAEALAVAEAAALAATTPTVPQKIGSFFKSVGGKIAIFFLWIWAMLKRFGGWLKNKFKKDPNAEKKPLDPVKVILIIIIILLLIAVGIMAYYIYTKQEEYVDIKDEMNDYYIENSDLSNQISTLEDQLDSKDDQIDELRDQLEAAKENNDELEQTLLGFIGDTLGDISISDMYDSLSSLSDDDDDDDDYYYDDDDEDDDDDDVIDEDDDDVDDEDEDDDDDEEEVYNTSSKSSSSSSSSSSSRPSSSSNAHTFTDKEGHTVSFTAEEWSYLVSLYKNTKNPTATAEDHTESELRYILSLR